MGLPQEYLRVPGGSCGGIHDDKEDNSDPKWDIEWRYSELPKRQVTSSAHHRPKLAPQYTHDQIRDACPCSNNFSGDAIPG